MRKRWTRKARVDLVPLLDVVVILVFFFLVFGNVGEGSAALPVNLPGSTTAPAAEPSRLVIAIDADGQYYVADHAVTKEEIPDLVAETLAENEQSQVVLFPDRDLAYEALVEALDLVRQGGADRPALGVRREPASEPAPED